MWRRLGSIRLSGALEALFEAGALDDHVTVAEAATHAGLAVLVPEVRDSLLDLGVLRRGSRVMAFGEDVQQLGAPLRGALDFEPDRIQGGLSCSHHFI